MIGSGVALPGLLDAFPLRHPIGLRSGRLYCQIARSLFDSFAAGIYPPGSRLPGERALALEYGVSRPTIREAIIALEIEGIVEDGAFVDQPPGGDAGRPADQSAGLEVVEARLVVEGEAAALAAAKITDLELATLDALIDGAERGEAIGVPADGGPEFHRLIARASRNAAICAVLEQLWWRQACDCVPVTGGSQGPDAETLFGDHRRIVFALRSRDPAQARVAMRAHLAVVLDRSVAAIEDAAIREAHAVARRSRIRLQHLLYPDANRGRPLDLDHP